MISASVRTNSDGYAVNGEEIDFHNMRPIEIGYKERRAVYAEYSELARQDSTLIRITEGRVADASMVAAMLIREGADWHEPALVIYFTHPKRKKNLMELVHGGKRYRVISGHIFELKDV